VSWCGPAFHFSVTPSRAWSAAGATVMGIGMTMLEETIFDSGTGRIANATFGDYLIPVNADVPDLDVVFTGNPDQFSPVGIKGLGEIGSSACRPRSPTRSTTPPADASAHCRSPSNSCCSHRMPELIALTQGHTLDRCSLTLTSDQTCGERTAEVAGRPGPVRAAVTPFTASATTSRPSASWSAATRSATT
jgi:Molybdopterin-binding domain of aldehyde dehydrogenase